MANEDAGKRASVEVHFAQRLAANEKKIRDRAMKKLRKWMEVKSLAKKDKAFTQEDFLKIWKGLHYCLWMQDKPLLQEEMSAYISNLVHVFSHPDTTLLFIEVFLETEAREWHGIDRWRMDKFMMLFRNVITQSFEFLKKQKWKKSVLTKFSDVLSSKIMTTNEEGVPDGLKIHLSDLYLDELEKVGADELSPDKVLILLEPFLQYTQNSRNLVIVERVISRTFESVVQQTVDDAMKAAEKQIENEDSDEEADDEGEDDDIPVRLQFDFKALADRLFQLGSSKDCVSKNRNMIYTLVKKFKDLDEGVLPVDPGEEDDGDVLTKQDFSKAVQDLDSMDAKLNKKKRRKKKKKNVEEEEEETTEIQLNQETNPSEKESKAKKGKRKLDDKTKNTDTSPPKKKKGKKEGKESSENIEEDSETNNKSITSTKKSNKKSNKQTTMHIGLDTLALKHLHDSEEENLNNSNLMTKKGKNKKRVKKMDVEQQEDNFNIKGDYSEESILWEDNSEQSVATSSKLSKNKAFSESVISQSPKLSVELDKKKRKSSQISVISSPVEKKTPKGKKNKVGDGNSPKSAGFAKFDKQVKTPPAFVKKSVNKVSTPKQAVNQKTPEAPSTCPDDPKKKVIFNMKRNKSLSFQDSIQSIQFSPGAFNPEKQPDHGIMKTPSPAVTRSKSTQKKEKRRASTGATKRPQAADFF